MKKKIFLTGSSGFVGSNLISSLEKYNIFKYVKGNKITINEYAVIHLAGKAHDLKKSSKAEEYYQINYEFTKVLFDAFLESDAKIFITLSSVKAVADVLSETLTENHIPNPITDYGKSKLLAENYILSKQIPKGKLVYILRPCMIYGPSNKGNLNLLYNIINTRFPWPLGSFENKRSYCSVNNLIFIINELLESQNIPSGVYNVADNETLSINEIYKIIASSKNIKPKIWNVPKIFIHSLALIGDFFNLPITTERLQKLTESYIVSNLKIKTALGKDLPIATQAGLYNTFQSFDEIKQKV